jgi:hypothetical protein
VFDLKEVWYSTTSTVVATTVSILVGVQRTITRLLGLVERTV